MSLSFVFADTIGNQLYTGIFSAQFVQFLVALLFAIFFPLTSAAVLNYAERKVMAWMQDRVGPIHTGPQSTYPSYAITSKNVLAAIDKKSIIFRND